MGEVLQDKDGEDPYSLSIFNNHTIGLNLSNWGHICVQNKG
jgi:hypothetical protein